MKRNNVVIIGAGLGGLECGYILARNGMKVTVLERESQIGGCIQTFKRGDVTFDTGFHYIGAMGEGEALNRLFGYFDLLSLPWTKLDEDNFDEVVIGERHFHFANGHARFAETLAREFPHERENLLRFTSLLKQVGDNIFTTFGAEGTNLSGSLFQQSAYQFINDTIGDPLLRKVLSGTSLKMELNAPTLPLYTFAQINDSFLRSAWRLRGGGALIADALADSIRGMGGEVITNAQVTKIYETDGQVTGVTIGGTEHISADYVISSVHPAYTVALVEESSRKMRNSYRKRIASLTNTFGMFTANIRLKPGAMPYLNKNIYIHKPEADLWNVKTTATESVLVNYSVPEDGCTTAANIDLLSPMSWEEVKKWAYLPVGRRGDDYVEYKHHKTEDCLRLVEKMLPALRDAIDHVYTSSPLSYHSYTASAEGCAYGIRKDYNNPMFTVLTPRTPIQNLLQTGQSLNLHGVLGVSMTAFLTCAEILGMDKIRQELKLK